MVTVPSPRERMGHRRKPERGGSTSCFWRRATWPRRTLLRCASSGEHSGTHGLAFWVLIAVPCTFLFLAVQLEFGIVRSLGSRGHRLP